MKKAEVFPTRSPKLLLGASVSVNLQLLEQLIDIQG